MDRAIRKLRVFTFNKESRAKKILKSEANWDGKFPIPVTWFGGASVGELAGIEIDHISGDDTCIWVPNAVSALELYKKGHSLIQDERVLEKRKTFRKEK